MPHVRSTSATCTIGGCTNPHLARGWCNKHYLRWKLHGDVHGLPRVPVGGLLQPYNFVDDGPRDVLEGVEPLNRDVPVSNIPNALLLFRLSESMDFGVAFETWARVQLGLLDADEAAWRLEVQLDKLRSAPSDKSLLTDAQRDELFAPLLAEGMTFREMAVSLALPLSLVVLYTWNAAGVKHAAQLADLEEELIANGCPSNATSLGRRFGLRHETVRRLCEKHAIKYRGDATPHRKYVARGTYTNSQKLEYVRLRSEGVAGADCMRRMGLEPDALRYFRRVNRLRLDAA